MSNWIKGETGKVKFDVNNVITESEPISVRLPGAEGTESHSAQIF